LERRFAMPVRTWLLAGLIVSIAHLALWFGFRHLNQDSTPPRPVFSTIVADLLPPPPVQPPPEPPPILPKPIPKPLPAVKQPPRLLSTPSPTQQNDVPASPPIIDEPSPVTPQKAAPAPTPEPAVEAPRYNAAYLNNPPPIYPLSARRRGMEGRVLVRAEILEDGSCSRVELKRSSGSDLLDQAALEAVKKWHFVPAKKGAQAISAWVDVPITFKLEL